MYTVLSRIVAPGTKIYFLGLAIIKYQNVKFKFIFCSKIGIYHKETANNIV